MHGSGEKRITLVLSEGGCLALAKRENAMGGDAGAPGWFASLLHVASTTRPDPHHQVQL